jgi:hypothetical protein
MDTSSLDGQVYFLNPTYTLEIYYLYKTNIKEKCLHTVTWLSLSRNILSQIFKYLRRPQRRVMQASTLKSVKIQTVSNPAYN